MSTLEEMKNVDVRTVDRDSLVDINENQIDESQRDFYFMGVTFRKNRPLRFRRWSKMTVEEMKNIDIRTVDPETLVDVNTIELDDSLSPEERAREFVRQVKNPYCFRAGDMIIKNVYAKNGITLRERFEQFARTL